MPARQMTRAVELAACPWQTDAAMKNFSKRFFVTMLASLLVASCVTTQPKQASLPALTFTHLPAIALKVAQIEVVSEYVSPLRSPHIEHTVPVAPEAALKLWAQSRLKAVGGKGVARLVIKTASVKDVVLKVRPGLTGAFYKDQSDRYEAAVSATLYIYEGGGASVGFAEAQATQSRTVAENASVNDRNRVQFEVVAAVLNGFDKELEKSIRAHLTRWLK